jgi:hypothetical protein
VQTTQQGMQGGFRDVWALCLFMANIAVIFYFGIHNSNGIASSIKPGGAASASQLSNKDLQQLWFLCLGLVILAATISGHKQKYCN